MKKEIHPSYRKVLFVDSSTGYRFICGSTLVTSNRETFEGEEYPVCNVSISSASHPFFTGSKQLVDAEGRVDKFMKRYAKKQQEIITADAAQEEASEALKAKKNTKIKKSPKKKG
ncbi:type B 50S ribosomal protein L31 [Candidatus Clavichlamydia salmonicola]|uniref:type B 50S ribosomal protein L31 n=1 Tax=Candidatus Clavichlamydia salmonicola TaxID=469812 RepID=UPI001890F9ED|nr:type B 50S ribosomal protein L31 [Candidatus Clavichlamydia salmonicola]